MSDKNAIKGLFVCDRCRKVCRDGEDEYGVYGPGKCPEAYSGRKTRLGCLGPLCDSPCELQKEKTDLTPEIAIGVIKYLVVELNKILITEKGA